MRWRKRKKKSEATGNWTDRAAGKIASAGIKLQTKFAEAMNKRTSRLSNQKLKIVLVTFFLSSGGFSIYLASHAIFGKDKSQPAIEVKPIHVPQHYDKTGSEINEPDSYISDELYHEIQEYKRYMDSLGQPIRPSLQDSIKVLEQIYHSQIK